MIKDFVYSFSQKRLPEALEFPLKSPRTDTDIILGVETWDNSDYQFDLGDGDILTRPSSINPIITTLSTGSSGATKIYVRNDNFKTLIIEGGLNEFDVSDISRYLPRLQKLIIGGTATTNIVDIPNNVRSFTLNFGGEITGYSIRRSFLYAPMNRFVLKNTIGTGLTSGEVDNLLQDLSLADWVGDKKVQITGANSARTSSSDSFVTTLEGKGVTVLTN